MLMLKKPKLITEYNKIQLDTVNDPEQRNAVIVEIKKMRKNNIPEWADLAKAEFELEKKIAKEKQDKEESIVIHYAGAVCIISGYLGGITALLLSYIQSPIDDTLWSVAWPYLMLIGLPFGFGVWLMCVAKEICKIKNYNIDSLEQLLKYIKAIQEEDSRQEMLADLRKTMEKILKEQNKNENSVVFKLWKTLAFLKDRKNN